MAPPTNMVTLAIMLLQDICRGEPLSNKGILHGHPECNIYDHHSDIYDHHSALGHDTARFELVNGQLHLKAHPNLEIVNTRTGKPLSLTTIRSRGREKAIREELGFMDWTRQGTHLPAQATTALRAVNQELGQAAAVVDTVELRDLGQTAKETSDAVHKMETTFTIAELDEILGTVDKPR